MTTTLARRAGALALIAATAATLTGCSGVLGARMTYTDTERTKITEIVLSGGSGDVAIRTAAVDETTIKRVIRRSSNPGESYRLDGTVLRVDTSCGDNCSVSYEIQAPVGVTVRGRLHSSDVVLDGVAETDLEVTSGDVMVRGSTGPVRLRSTSGDINVLDAKSSVRIQATSGDIQAMNVDGPVDVKLTSGDIGVKLTKANSVTTQSTSGDVNVIVPRGSYKIVTSAGSGDTGVVGVTNDPSATDVLNLRTASGDVSVTAAA